MADPSVLYCFYRIGEIRGGKDVCRAALRTVRGANIDAVTHRPSGFYRIVENRKGNEVCRTERGPRSLAGVRYSGRGGQ
jgi:hypothetical protein